MTFVPLPGAPNSSSIDLTEFLAVAPVGSTIKCRVTANGLEPDGQPAQETITTGEVLIQEASEPPQVDPVIDSVAILQASEGAPAVAEALITYDGDFAADGWSVEWNWSREVEDSGGDLPFQVELEYSITTDFRYRVPAGEGIGEYSSLPRVVTTKTITWTVGSNSEITHGTFVDGSPWVIDNGDLHLLKVTPEPGIFVDRQIADEPNPGDPASQREWPTNGTIINPDMGKVPTEFTGQDVTFPNGDRDNWPNIADWLVRCTDNQTVNPEDIEYMLPLDGRSGITSKENPSGGSVQNSLPGDFYFNSVNQVWNRLRTKIEFGDMVLSCISHVDNTPVIDERDIFDDDGNFLYTRRTDYTKWGGFKREPIYDVLGCLTVVNQNRTGFLRPPVNWDPTDKLNRPYLQMRTDLDDFNFDMPDYSMYTDEINWEGKLSDWYDYEDRSPTTDEATPIRLGGVRLLPGGTEHDDTVQGWTRSYCGTWNEYASREAQDTELQTMISFDNAETPERRNAIRAALTQRGVDLYGAYRSLGKWSSANGGHSEPYDWYLLYAYMTTLDPDIFSLLNGNIGMERNGTAKTILNFDERIARMGARRGQLYKIDPNNKRHNCRLNDLNIIARGTTLDGAVEYIEVEPPVSNVVGRGHPHTRYYHLSGYDDRSSGGDKPGGIGTWGRWGMRNNLRDIERNKFSGFYVRGSNGISRVIGNEGNRDRQLTKYGGTWYTDTPQRFFLQRPEVIGPEDTTIDLAPFVMEDLDIEGGADRAYFTAINTNNLGSLAGPQHYLWTNLRGQCILHFMTQVIGGRDQLPDFWKVPYDQTAKIWSDPILNTTVTSPSSIMPQGTSYQSGRLNQADTGEKLQALIRKFTLNGEPGVTPTFSIIDRLNLWPHDTYTWPEISNDWIANPTLFVGWPSDTIESGTARVEDIDGNNVSVIVSDGVELEGTGFDRFYRVVTSDGRDGVFARSKASRFVPYEYVDGKNLYMWISGQDKPIKMELIEENKTDDRTWDQTWALPADIGVWPNSTQQYSLRNTGNIIYANDGPLAGGGGEPAEWPAGVWRIQSGETFTDTEHDNNVWSFEDYAAVTRPWANTPEHRPIILAKPKNANEVIEVLNYCQSNNVPFKVRSGTHSYNAQGTGLGAVIIDMRLIDECSLDTTNEWMDIGGGAALWQVNAELNYDKLAPGASTPSAYGDADTGEYAATSPDDPNGYWTPSGSCPRVGYSGVASGGGISLNPNREGLMCDLILEADVVIPDGMSGYRMVTATRENEFSDLLDGLRGLGNNSLGIVTRWRTKVLPRKKQWSVRFGLAWRPNGGSWFKQTDTNLWAIKGTDAAVGSAEWTAHWQNVQNSDEWAWIKAVYEAYQDTLMDTTATYPAGHPIAGRRIWPHGREEGIDGTSYVWLNWKRPDDTWSDYSITAPFQFWSYEDPAGLMVSTSAGDVPAHLFYLTQFILDRAIAKDPSRFDRFRSGTKNGVDVDALYQVSVTEAKDQGVNSSGGWRPEQNASNDINKQVNGAVQDQVWGLNYALCIPNNSPNDAAFVDRLMQYYQDIVININPFLPDGGTGRQGIYHRYYTHSSSPDGPVANPQIVTHDTSRDVLGWRDRPNEIQMFEELHPTFSFFWQENASGNYELTDLGHQFYDMKIKWFDDAISLYGGNDPRSYIGYIDSLWNYATLPNGQPLDINQFYYGTQGVQNLTNLKAKYDPQGRFPFGPQTKTIDVNTT